MTIPFGADAATKHFGHTPRTLAAGTSAVIDTRNFSRITITTEAASTATVSRVNSVTAVANSAAVAQNFTVAAATRGVTAVDWPFFRVTAAGGTVHVGLGGSMDFQG